MKINLETNILIAATFWNGDSERIIQKIEKKEIELILSKEIIEEFSNVLEYEEIQEKIKKKKLEMKRTVEKIISLSTIVEPTEKLFIVKDDHDDNKILECAKAGNVNYLISNDKHLLNIKQFEEIKIITPQEFLALL